MALEVERRMDAKDVIRILNEAVLARGCVPEFTRSENGLEFIALALQDWIAQRGFKTLYIKPGAPWQNAYSESFNSRFRDEFLNRELCGGLSEAKVLGNQHRHWHNFERPHSSLEDQTPVEFAQRSLAAASVTLQQPQGCALPLNTQPTTKHPNPTQNSHSEWIKNRGQARRDDRTDIRPGVKERCGKGALTSGESLRHGLDGCGKIPCVTQVEKHPRRAKP